MAALKQSKQFIEIVFCIVFTSLYIHVLKIVDLSEFLSVKILTYTLPVALTASVCGIAFDQALSLGNLFGGKIESKSAMRSSQGHMW